MPHASGSGVAGGVTDIGNHAARLKPSNQMAVIVNKSDGDAEFSRKGDPTISRP